MLTGARVGYLFVATAPRREAAVGRGGLSFGVWLYHYEVARPVPSAAVGGVG
jgi:hypothetical protein